MKKLRVFFAGFTITIFFLTCFQLPGMAETYVRETATITPQGYEASIAAAREAVANELATGISSSATVAVMVDGKIVYAEGFGIRDRAKNLKADTETQFNIGSVSKIFAAAGVLILEQEGKLSLDNPVTDYISDFTMNDARYRDITVRMLLNHTSGLPGTNMKDGFTTVKNRNYVEETLEMLKTSSLVHDPGKISIYCNDGFTIAEAVIERVSGMSYPDFLEQKIFSKMGLDNTSAHFINGNENIARVYEEDSSEPLPVEYVNLLGSGGLSSTAIDLCKFGEILQSDAVLSPAMIEEYTKAQYGPDTVPIGEPFFNAGLGWDYVQVYKFNKQGIDVLAKNGGTVLYCSQLYVLPKEHISVAVIFAGFANPAGVADTILQTLLEEKGIVEKPSSDTVLPDDAEVPDNLRDYEGFYSSAEGVVKVEISPDHKGIILSAYDGKSFLPMRVLAYKENGRFYGPDGSNCSFAKHADREVIVAYSDSSDTGVVRYEKLIHLNDTDTGEFAGKVWIPRNLNQYDFYSSMLGTTTIPETPGYIVVYDGTTYVPLALKSPTDTRVSFNYMRDQYEVRLQNIEGETILYRYGYSYSDASELPVVAEGDTLRIDTDGQNKAGRMRYGGLVSFAVPEGGRVVVFSPELSLIYDSLTTSSFAVYAEEGSYIIAVGKPGDAFTISNYAMFKDINDHWAKDYINRLASAKILEESGNHLYQPDENMMGLDFLVFLQRAVGVTPDDLFYSGDFTSFKHGQPITRGQAISIITDVMALAGLDTNLSTEETDSLTKEFSDLHGIDDVLKQKAALLIKLGILQGRSNKRMAPGDVMTRGEAAATVFRMLRILMQ